MRWPWAKSDKAEARESGGSFSDAVVRLIEAQAAGTAADSGSTAAIEAAAGALSRAFASARVEGPAGAVEAVTGDFLALAGRDLIRTGQSLHAIRTGRDGLPRLVPCASWHFEGSHDPDGWTVRATAYGPSTSTTWNLPASSVVFLRWGGSAGQPYVGTGPTRFASLTARLQAEAERSLADEAGGPIAQLLAVPSAGSRTGADGEDDDPLALLQADIAKARGKAALLETTAAGFGDGMSSAPRRDWIASRLGPAPPAALAEIRRDAFSAVLAACGTPPGLFMPDADGTAQREALRRWHLGTVLPLARMVEAELSAKLEADIRLRFDNYPLDLQARAVALAKLVETGMERAEALSIVGLLFTEAE